ncbi:MAG: hypothetical protein H0X19_13875, partial [Rubrobacter sp.]|nr:hypothetical protein [Rubrobacter sp.]
LHQDGEKTQVTNVGRWKSERGGLLRGRGPSVVGRSFEEDLALFERQAREEVGERAGLPAGLVSREALSA